MVVGSVDTPSGARDVVVVGDYAHVADSFAGVQVIDISDPTRPTIVGAVPTFRARGIAAAGHHLYVADAESGLRVVDIANPTFPSIAGSIDTPGSAERVRVQGNFAYVADAGAGLQIIDISDPTAPEIVGSIDSPAYTWDLAVSQSHAYLADGSLGLQVVNVVDPSSPTRIGGASLPGNAFGAEVAGSLAFVVDGNGLHLFPLQCPSTTAAGSSGGASGGLYALRARPNPAVGGTTLSFEMSEGAPIRLFIYDVAGRLVRRLWERPVPSGHVDAWWDGRDDRGRAVGRGLYLARLTWAGGESITRLTVFK
jgi:hypothetical protein